MTSWVTVFAVWPSIFMQGRFLERRERHKWHQAGSDREFFCGQVGALRPYYKPVPLQIEGYIGEPKRTEGTCHRSMHIH